MRGFSSSFVDFRFELQSICVWLNSTCFEFLKLRLLDTRKRFLVKQRKWRGNC